MLVGPAFLLDRPDRWTPEQMWAKLEIVVEQPSVPTIGDALRFVQMSGIFYCPSELTEPWGLALPPMDGCLWFHVVTAGGCTIDVDVDGVEPRALGPGDMVVVPHGAGHRFRGAEPAPTPLVFDLPHEHVSDRYAILRHGGGGAATSAICGGVRFDDPTARHLVDALPPLIHIERAGAPRADYWIHATLDLIADEVRAVRPGGDAVVSRLCDILVIQAIRSWIEHDPGARTGWLGALRDERIGRAIAAIHGDPARDWSVATLAHEAAMSRSSFAARFTDLVGEPAMSYVTRWRMYVAHGLLVDGELTVTAVAQRVGYDSEAAFSRAYKRVMGASPRASVAA